MKMTQLNKLKFSSLMLFAVLMVSNAFAADAEAGKKTYQQACAMCHASGVAGAPVIGKKADWIERAKKGNDALYASANNGLGAMPAKGGQAQLSDADVVAAVDYMLEALDGEQSAEMNMKIETPVVALTSLQEKGRELAYDRKKGNCVACHQIMDADFPGNSAPALSNMKVRYADKLQLKNQIADPTVSNPNSIMPPYGRHQILTAEELELVANFIYAL